MRRLILFRHAKAEPRGSGEEDFDRALAPRGRDDATLVGKALAEENLAPDCALISPARRTAETWIFAREAFPRIRAELDRTLYDASVEDIRATIERVADRCETLMVVGHNPGLHELAVELLIDSGASAAEVERVAARFPTATAVVYQIDHVGRASLESVYFAKDLGGEGEG
ncbi:MAG TPA: histidine phosphatase family protein [Caulobacteraceae bacterium]|jgi:phosphohistidine phosphatase